VAQPFQLAHDDRGALRVGEVAQALHQLRHLLASQRLLGHRRRPTGESLGQLGAVRRPVAQVVERGVADDPVEPGPEVDIGIGVTAEGEQRLREGVLGEVLGAAAGRDRSPAVRRRRVHRFGLVLPGY